MEPGTVRDVITLAESQIGTKESPPNSNNVKYNTWYYGRPVSGPDYPWCVVFCQWVYDKCDVELPAWTASCTALMNAAKQKRLFVTKNYRPGDLLLYDFKNSYFPQHCGILKVHKDGIYYAIEGNTGIGNNVNGGEVMLRERYLSNIIGAVRPIFGDDGKEIDMTRSEFIEGLTDKEAYLLFTKAMRYADTLDEPEWSDKEGYWDDAVEKKIINSDTPEGLVRRDQMIAVLGRLGIL